MIICHIYANVSNSMIQLLDSTMRFQYLHYFEVGFSCWPQLGGYKLGVVSTPVVCNIG